MSVSVSVLLKNINYSHTSFYRILNGLGYSKTNLLTLYDLQILYKSIIPKHYKTKLLIFEIDKQIKILESKRLQDEN